MYIYQYEFKFSRDFFNTRDVDNSGNLFLLAWTIMASFLIMAFNCNLRACLIKNDFEEPVSKLLMLMLFLYYIVFILV